LRGGQAYLDDKGDRRPHLTGEQSMILLGRAIDDYILSNETHPARLVIHKTSLFTEEEKEGFLYACKERGINRVDLITFLDTTDRAFRFGKYPPLRGTLVSFDEKAHLLYTRGSVPFYKTYSGLYIPQPLEIRIAHSDSSVEKISREILGLTKMNWNSTRFDGKFPITLRCSQKVGEIMKYLKDGYEPKPDVISYGYYM
jgi:argonaute-like protein implicated in RNA metabolism and viral defense